MFHRAPPLDAGSGVRISTPGWVRSSQLSMFNGLPGRTSNTTADVTTMLPSGSCATSCVISPASSISWMSGRRDSAAMSAGNPLMTFCACVVLPPNEVENWTCWSSCVSFQSDWKVEISLPYTS